jgi:hypothetical protein
MKAMSLSARARRDGLDLDELYPTEVRGTGYAAGWIERGDDPPTTARGRLADQRVTIKESPWVRRRATAWLATQSLLFCVGAVALIGAMAALPPLVIAGGTAALGVAWCALYSLISKLEARK